MVYLWDHHLHKHLQRQFFAFIDKLWLEHCLNEFKRGYYKLHEDDIFVLFKSQDHLAKF